MSASDYESLAPEVNSKDRASMETGNLRVATLRALAIPVLHSVPPAYTTPLDVL